MAGADTAGFLVVPLLWRCGWMFVTESAVLAPAACTRSAESSRDRPLCTESRRQKTKDKKTEYESTEYCTETLYSGQWSIEE